MPFIDDCNRIAKELHTKTGRPKKVLPRRILKRPALPPELEGVSLMTSAEICEALRASPSWWNEQVRIGSAPQPDVQRMRFTRWYVNTIRAYLISLSSQPKATAALTAKAKKASDAARGGLMKPNV